MLVAGIGYYWKLTIKTAEEVERFLVQKEAQVQGLQRAAHLAYYQATVSGEDSDFDRYMELSYRLANIYSNPHEYALLKNWRKTVPKSKRTLQRQVDICCTTYLANQIDRDSRKEMLALMGKIERTFATYRAQLNGRPVSDVEIKSILQQSRSDSELKEAWVAGTRIGEKVAPDLLKLVKLRNEAARELGYENYYDMALRLDDLDPGKLDKIFAQVDRLTREPYLKEKQKLDQLLSSRYGIPSHDLRPWHYGDIFLQRYPSLGQTKSDYILEDPVQPVRDFYAGIGIPVDDVVARSDLYSRSGKYQHAYCIDIDRWGDIRIVANLTPDRQGVATLLHELGHAAYFKNIDSSLPWLLRSPAHTLTTEAIAILMARVSSDPLFISHTLHKQVDSEMIKACRYSLKMDSLVFSRWALVMYHFERQMYQNPDQDLNRLWQVLIKKYQMITYPQTGVYPYWAAKIHLATAPCYYHNYLLGEILAAQINHYLLTKVLTPEESRHQSLWGNKKVGDYLTKAIFAPGAEYSWEELTEQATGEAFTTRYYYEMYLN